MFIRKKLNKSGSVSVQIISKDRGCYKVIESVGVGRNDQDISNLLLKARALLKQHKKELYLFVDEEESVYESILSNLSNDQIQVAGPELIYGKLFDKIGYAQIEAPMFRHLVITRLYNPGKMKYYPLNMNEKQKELYALIIKNFKGVPLAKTGRSAKIFVSLFF